MASQLSLARVGKWALLAVFALVLIGCGNSRVTRETFQKIKNDMTLQEVEALLGEGAPQGDGSMVAAQAGVDLSGGAPPPSTQDYLWENGKKSITVTFNKQNKVVQKRSEGL
jgi:hypothetical protein